MKYLVSSIMYERSSVVAALTTHYSLLTTETGGLL